MTLHCSKVNSVSRVLNFPRSMEISCLQIGFGGFLNNAHLENWSYERASELEHIRSLTSLCTYHLKRFMFTVQTSVMLN